MRKCSADVNHIRLHGAVGEAPVYSHLNHGVEFYTFPLVVRRLSGAEDQVNVVAPLELLRTAGAGERADGVGGSTDLQQPNWGRQ